MQANTSAISKCRRMSPLIFFLIHTPCDTRALWRNRQHNVTLPLSSRKQTKSSRGPYVVFAWAYCVNQAKRKRIYSTKSFIFYLR